MAKRRKYRAYKRKGEGLFWSFRHRHPFAVPALVVCLIALLVLFLYIFFVHPTWLKPWQRTVHEFHNPEGYDVRGIDVSHYQKDIDWVKLRNADINASPIRFIFVKATEGENMVDECFAENFRQAKENDFITGAYHFFNPNGDPLLQAQNFIRQVKLEPGDLPPILDIETRGKLPEDVFNDHLLLYIKTIQKHYGIAPIIYTGVKFREHHLSSPVFDSYPFWIAHYYVDKLRYTGAWSFWQYTDAGTVDGIDGYVDMNIFNGKLSDLIALTIPEPSVHKHIHRDPTPCHPE